MFHVRMRIEKESGGQSARRQTPASRSTSPCYFPALDACPQPTRTLSRIWLKVLKTVADYDPRFIHVEALPTFEIRL